MCTQHKYRVPAAGSKKLSKCWIDHYLHLRGKYLYNESFCHFSSIHPRILLAATSLPAEQVVVIFCQILGFFLQPN